MSEKEEKEEGRESSAPVRRRQKRREAREILPEGWERHEVSLTLHITVRCLLFETHLHIYYLKFTLSICLHKLVESFPPLFVTILK